MRTTVPPDSIAASVRAAIQQLHPSIVIFNVTEMSTLVAAQTAPSRFTTWLLGLFAATALALAVIGIYGVMSYLVAQRQREFGIRLALGADRKEIVALVLRHGALMVGIGLVIGIGGALVLSRVLGTLLFDVGAADPASAAGDRAARHRRAARLRGSRPIRATRVSPVSALRAE